MVIYSFDSSAFITAWRDLYSPEIFPGVWERLDELARNGRLKCPDETFERMAKFKRRDALKEWLLEREEQIIYRIEDHPTIQNSVVLIQEEEYDNGMPYLSPPEGSKSGDDIWVVALAHNEKGCVVTYENSAKNSIKRTKIPDVCERFGIPCLTLAEVLRQEQWRFL